MSLNVNPTNGRSSQPAPTPPDQPAPTFLRTAGTATKVFFAGLILVGALASGCVGIAFLPFSREGGFAAFAASASLFALAATLLCRDINLAPQSLSTRNVTAN